MLGSYYLNISPTKNNKKQTTMKFKFLILEAMSGFALLLNREIAIASCEHTLCCLISKEWEESFFRPTSAHSST